VLGHHGGTLVAMNLTYRCPHRIQKVILSGTSRPKSEEEVREFSDRLESTHDVLDRDGQSLIKAWHRYNNYLPEATIEEVLLPYII